MDFPEQAVAEPKTQHLRLYTDGSSEPVCPQVDTMASLPELLRAYEQTTGWSLRYRSGPAPRRPNSLTWSAPANPGVGVTPGHFTLDRAADPRGERVAVDRAAACELAAAVTAMLDELIETRHALWQREAELAAGVPLVRHADEQQHLALRLEAALKAGAEAVGCRAAALYLLDEGTSCLKLRSMWGLPFERFTSPARPLKGAVADLEALLGHAVVLNEPELMHHWRAPEGFATAVCVPVSTPTSLLGTLWLFCDEKRDFDDRQTNVLEVVAGRIAADLEREMLLSEGMDWARVKRQLAAAERFQQSQLPSISPLLDGWQVSGFTSRADGLGSEFYDWFCLPNGLLSVAVGAAEDKGLTGAMSAAALKAALRAHAQYHREADAALRKLNLTLWTGSAGDQRASLFLGLIETATGRVCGAMAGHPSVIVVGPHRWESLTQPAPPLGEGPEADFEPLAHELNRGEALLVFTEGIRDARDQRGRPLGEAELARPLVGQTRLSADQLAVRARAHLDTHAPGSGPAKVDRTLLVVKRAPD